MLIAVALTSNENPYYGIEDPSAVITVQGKNNLFLAINTILHINLDIPRIKFKKISTF